MVVEIGDLFFDIGRFTIVLYSDVLLRAVLPDPDDKISIDHIDLIKSDFDILIDV